MIRQIGSSWKRNVVLTAVLTLMLLPAGAWARDRSRDDDDRDRRESRWDRGDRYDRHDDRDVRVNLGFGARSGPAYESRTERVWVEPVYRTECERVWREPIFETRKVVRHTRWGTEVSHERVMVSPGGWQTIERPVLVEPGHWEYRTAHVRIDERPSWNFSFGYRD